MLDFYMRLAAEVGLKIWPVLFWFSVLFALLTVWACWVEVSRRRLWTARRRLYECEFADLPTTERMIKVSQALDAAEKLGSWYPVK